VTVQVSLFARARDLSGVATLAVELPEGGTVGELRTALLRRCPDLHDLLPRCAIAVNEEFAADSIRVPEFAALALIPPVSGGAC